VSSDLGVAARGRTALLLHFAGSAVMRFAPPLLQLALLVVVARRGSIDDVGRLALASAVSFLCGALAEAGFSTTLSIPRVAFGLEHPPLRATLPLRVTAAVGGSALYAALWGTGLGHHDPVFLIVTPLPFFLALATGYAGAMNASGLLRLEGLVSLGESALVLILAVAGSFAISALPAVLIALTLGRAIGTAVRAIVLRQTPQTDSTPPRGVARIQAGFFLLTGAVVLQGQADMLAIGFAGTLAVAAVYGPLVRTAASALLVTESLTWGLYGAAHPDEHGGAGWVGRHWRLLTVALSVLSAILFVLLAEPFLRVVLDRSLPHIRSAVVIFGITMVVRAASLIWNVTIVRAGRQREEIPFVALAAVALAVGATIAARADSITSLAVARLVSEVIIAGGFLFLSTRAHATTDVAPVQRPMELS
jgi:O-antigen/teichoic acid export membrane protein